MGKPPEPAVQETTPFSLAMEVEEDIEQEIENFVRFKRRGEYLQAQELFQQTLSRHLTLFPVIAEYADLLLEQGKFRTLSEFLDIQIQYMESMLEEEEVELLRIMRSLVRIYMVGALRPALEQADITWSFLCRRRFEVSPGTLPGDVEIHIFEVYIKILVFAFTTSNWVGINDMKCPWVHHSRGSCEFVQWYAMLLENGQLWNASNILVILLKLLPSLETQDVAILFRENSFGDVRNSQGLIGRNETENLLIFTVSFNRAQALLDLALGVYRKRGYDGDDYEKLYEIALAYHLLAEDLVGIIFCDSSLGLDTARYTIQRMAFEQASKVFLKEIPTKYRPVDLQHFAQDLLRQDMQCYIISQLRLLFNRLTISSNPYISYDLKTFLDIQLHTQGDFTGFIRTCDLCYTLPLCDSPEAVACLSRKASLSSEIDSCLLHFDTESQISALWQSMPVFSKMLGVKTERATQMTLKTFDIPLYRWAIHRSSRDLNSMLRKRGMLEEKLPTYDEISLRNIERDLPLFHWDLEKIARFAQFMSEKQLAPGDRRNISTLGDPRNRIKEKDKPREKSSVKQSSAHQNLWLSSAPRSHADPRSSDIPPNLPSPASKPKKENITSRISSMLTCKGEEKQAMPRDGFARPFSILGTSQAKVRGFFSNDETAFKDIPYGILVWDGFSGWSGEEDILDLQKRRFEALGEGIHRHSLRDIRQQKRLHSFLRGPINDGRNSIDDRLGPSLISNHVEQYEITKHSALPVPAYPYWTQTMRESPISNYYQGDRESVDYHGDTGRGARIIVEDSRRRGPERAGQYSYDYNYSTGDKLEGISDVEQYQSAKASYSTPATSSIPEIVDGTSSNNSSQKSRSNSSYEKETSSKEGEGKDISLMMDGIRLGFKEEAVHGKMINIRSDDAGGFHLSLGGNANRKPKAYLPAGSSYSDKRGTASRRELVEDMRRTRDDRRVKRGIVNAGECLLCGVASMNKGVLTRHLKDKHFPQFEYSCPKEGCPTTQPRKDKIQNHIHTHEGINRESFITKEFPCLAHCPICRLITNSWDEFYACIIGHHNVGAQQPERSVRRTRDDQRLERGASDSLDKTAPKGPLVEKYGELKESIGHGNSSNVRIAYKTDSLVSGSEKIYAVKEYRELPQETRKGYQKRLTSEFSISSALYHSNAVRALDLLQDSNGVFSMVMEYCAAGDLYSLITNEGKLEPEESDCFFKQLIRGLEYLHDMGVAHRDLKPESLLLTTKGALKIASFDKSECFRLAWEKEARLSFGLCGHGPYIAPEEYTEKKFYSSVADIWATGLIYMAMRTGQNLWGVSGQDDQFYKQYLEDRRDKRGYSPIERLHQVPCRNAIYAILDPDPSRRITASQMLKTEWLHQIKLCAAGEEGL